MKAIRSKNHEVQIVDVKKKIQTKTTNVCTSMTITQ
jgi:hypothetical protein